MLIYGIFSCGVLSFGVLVFVLVRPRYCNPITMVTCCGDMQRKKQKYNELFFIGRTSDAARHALIMDEVDGMAGNEDRGGMQVESRYNVKETLSSVKYCKSYF